VRTYKNGTFKNFNEGLEGLRANQVLVRGDDYFAATSGGIFIRDNDGSKWVLAGAQGRNMLSIAYDIQDACQLAAGGAGVTYSSTNLWHYLDLDHLRVKSVELSGCIR